ncbi:MAG: molybdenum cofactor biosynthesis protein MoaE [Acidobacteria bacterium]|nr:molybdenum cofactor biosynthesis protein MoaE [Acidobacteriota bacterium]
MFRLTFDPIDAGSIRDALVQAQDGAVVVFEGITRDHARGRKVLCLEYQAYETMALKKLQEIGARARQEYQIREISIVHRLGRLCPTDCSVAIVVAAEHRAAAFDACRFAIDNIKKFVPIWKKEVYEDGETWIDS